MAGRLLRPAKRLRVAKLELADLELLNHRAYDRVARQVDRAHTETLRAAASELVPQLRWFVARAAERNLTLAAGEALVPSIVVEVGIANGDLQDLAQALVWALAQEQGLSARVVSLEGGAESGVDDGSAAAAQTAEMLILGDLESIDKTAFSDFVFRLSEASLPFARVLIMLVSPAVGFPATLKLPSCGLLQVLHLEAPSPLWCFSNMVADLFVLCECPVDIDPGVLRHLCSLFARHRSLRRTTCHLKLLARHFFQASPCRHLCLAREPDFRADVVQSIGDGKLLGVDGAPAVREDDDDDGTELARRVEAAVYGHACQRWTKMVLFKLLRTVAASGQEEHPGAMMGLQLVVLEGGGGLTKRVQGALVALGEANGSELARVLAALASLYAELANSGDSDNGPLSAHVSAHDGTANRLELGSFLDLKAKVSELALLGAGSSSAPAVQAVFNGLRFESMYLLQAIYASAVSAPPGEDGDTRIETVLSFPPHYLEELQWQFEPEPRSSIRYALEGPGSHDGAAGPGGSAYQCIDQRSGAIAAADWFAPFASEESSGWSADTRAGSHGFVRTVADLEHAGAVQLAKRDGVRFLRMLY
jgi:hypothetical protein